MKNWSVVPGNLLTKWSNDVSADLPWPEYPRPQLVRKSWINLNGLWDYQITSKMISQQKNISPEGKILVPYPIESALSGVKRALLPKEFLWYQRTFEMEIDQNKRVFLHFGAVDFETTVWVNDIQIGGHQGGDVPFSFEITKAIQTTKTQKIIIRVWDPTDSQGQERGKQVLDPYAIYYNAMSGIWQTVWIETVAPNFVENLEIIPNIDTQKIHLLPNVNMQNFGSQENLRISYEISGEDITTLTGRIEPNQKSIIEIPELHLWGPTTPYLYSIRLKLLEKDIVIDEVESYFGMRKIAIQKDAQGIPRIMLNNEFLFQYGPLDQGWWPDGLYTAPTDEALKWDIEITQQMGFNMIRKHIKIEPARWYYHCDKMGMLVWQDMPSGGNYSQRKWLLNFAFLFLTRKTWTTGRLSKKGQAQYFYELESLIKNLKHFPSIVVWVPFNEAWGQFKTAQVTEHLRKLDSSRVIDSASGWVDFGTGDIHSIHKYPGPAIPKIEEERALALSEFGGLGLVVEEHLWQLKKKNWGYRKMDDELSLWEKYQELMEEMRPLIQQGLSAAVYTQTTDVEQEVNGLITYDRKVIKIDVQKIQQLNQSLYKK